MSAFVLVLFVAITFLLETVSANPMSFAWYPTEPITAPPIITITSPLNNQVYNLTDNFNITSIWLNFTVSKPKEWFRQAPHDIHEYIPGPYLVLGRLTFYHYILDGTKSHNVSTNEGFHFVNQLEEYTDYSIELMLSKGVHNITIVIQSETAYVSKEEVEKLRFLKGEILVPVTASSEVLFSVEPVNLTSQSSPKIEEAPMSNNSALLLIGSVAVGVLIAIVVLVLYTIRHKKIK